MKKITKTKKTGKATIGIGAGLVAAGAAAAAAGYYFYGSPKAKSHRKIGTKWAIHMKDEIIKEAKNLKKPDLKAISAIVNHVTEKYHAARSASAEDLTRAAKELKANWKILELETKRTMRKAATKRIK